MPVPLLFGPYGSPAAAHIKQFATYGANTLWFHGFDPSLFESCEQHQIKACVEFKTFRADFAARPELIPTGVDGRPIRYAELVQGVCLSQTAFLEETAASLLAGLRGFEPAGIWLDYLTYAGWFETPQPDLQQSCFCPDCIAEFCQANVLDATTPAQILQKHADAWTRHKCRRIAQFAAHYAGLIRRHRPGCLIGAYMCPWLPDEFEGALKQIFAQDYDLLAPAIDIFTPLIYVKKRVRNAGWGRSFLEQSPNFVPSNRPVQLILDNLDYPESLFETARSAVPSWGIQLFGGANVFGDTRNAALFRQAVTQIQGATRNAAGKAQPIQGQT